MNSVSTVTNSSRREPVAEGLQGSVVVISVGGGKFGRGAGEDMVGALLQAVQRPPRR